MTADALPRSEPQLPHAATTRSDFFVAHRMCLSLSAPTGSGARRRIEGLVETSPKRFTTVTAPNLQRRARPMQRRIVGSSPIASALLGFSITNVTVAPVVSQRRQSS